jgi:sulfur-oxidizing protein SoxZ
MTSRIGPARIRMPAQAKPGEVFEVRTMVEHPNESGFRHDNLGRPIPRHIVTSFECAYNGREVFRATLHPAISTNPYMTFFVKAVDSGEFVFTWKDDQGGVTTVTQAITVVQG